MQVKKLCVTLRN